MPISPGYSESLSTDTVALYQNAETLLLERIGRALAADMDAPDWAERKLIQMQLLQAQASGIVDELAGRSATEIAAAILKAYNRGAAVAQVDLQSMAVKVAATPLPPGLPAVESLVAEAVSNVAATHGRILRVVPDVFRTVIAQSSPQVLLGTQTRREAAQSALNAFADRGITGFVDRSGRNWSLESYTEMAVRTSTANAATQGNTDRLLNAGQDLVIVSNAPQECPLCRPLEGEVLSLTGTPRVDSVDVWGTLEQAKADGLYHPGCRHSHSIYLPGVTEAPTRTADPDGDAARQKLRYLERQTRAAKRRSAVALDEPAKRAADQRVRAYQAKIRSHVSSTSAKRQSAREQIGRAT